MKHYLYDQVFPTFAESLQHAQEQVSRLHQVFEVRLWLLGFVVFSQQGQEDLPVLHQVKNVT